MILPDVMLQDVMDKLIQPDVLIVLVNHPSPLIQQGVIKVGKICVCLCLCKSVIYTFAALLNCLSNLMGHNQSCN